MSAPDDRSSPSRSPRVPFWAVLIIMLLAGIALFGDRGVLRVLQAGRHKALLEEEIRQLEETRAGLREEIKALRSDRRYLEGIARRELGMVREDERVYQFPPEPAAGPSAPSERR